MSTQVPSIKLVDSEHALVHRWGMAGRALLRNGDRLILGPETDDALLLLVPVGHGRPMLGRRRGTQLCAEPGGFPASSRRWQVAGSVVAVERDLERSILDSGRWFLCSRLESTGSDVDPSEARSTFLGGWKNASEVDALTLRAAVAPETSNVRVACAVALSPDLAGSLLAETPTGKIRISMAGADASGPASVIPGPWPQGLEAEIDQTFMARPSSASGVQLRLFGDSRMLHAC